MENFINKQVRLLILVFAAIMAVMSSCDKDDKSDENAADNGSVLKSCIRRYILPDSFSVSQDGDIEFYGICCEEGYTAIKDKPLVVKDSLYKGTIHVTGYDGVYDSLCKVYNDESYNKMVPYDDVWTIGSEFDSITIVSDRDYDEHHLAGQSLNDITNLKYETYRDFIKNGYSLDGIRDKYNMTGYLANHIKTFSECTREDLTLIYSARAHIEFPNAPTMSKEHTFTVKLYKAGGKIMSAKFNKTFE